MPVIDENINECLFLDTVYNYTKQNNETLKSQGYEMKVKVPSIINFTNKKQEEILIKVKQASSFIAKYGTEGPATSVILREGFHLPFLSKCDVTKQ